MKKLIFSLLFIFCLFSFKNEANALCFGCGGQQGGNMPCYTAGQVISTGCWYETTNVLVCETQTFLGGCQIRSYWTRNGAFLQQYDYSGGCACLGIVLPYHETLSPFLPFATTLSDTGNIPVNTTISLSKLEVWKLVDSGQVVYTWNDSLPANQIAVLPRSIFQTGGDYLVVGYTRLNNADVFISLRNSGNSITQLKSFSSWGIPDSIDLQRKTVTYTSNNEVMMFIQHLDKTGRIIKGTHSAILSVHQVSSSIPNIFSLYQNYPNPFNPSTKINFDIPKQSVVKLVIYDILGKEVITLVNENLKGGQYLAEWNASGLASGMYFYKLEAGDFIATKKMILIK